MKMFLISDDSDSRTGMGLAGVESAASPCDDLLSQLENIETDVGIVVIANSIASKFPDVIRLFQKKSFPLLVVI
jgi:V/A-type H+-transporting ATPase subunit F